MSEVEIFFTNDEVHADEMLDYLIEDIRDAKYRLGMAAAWFTDTNIAQAIIDSQAARKTIILNNADIKRESVKAYKMILEASGICSVSFDDKEFCIFVEGGENWKEGIMHNKYIVADNVVWTGSYNFTFNAKKNKENIVRIEDPRIADFYYCNLWELHDPATAMQLIYVLGGLRLGYELKNNIFDPEAIKNDVSAFSGLREVDNA